MALSKDRLRKIHGITEPTGPADPAVLGRRKWHEAAAKWLAKWSSPLQLIFATYGFFFVLLPVLSKNWHGITKNIYIIECLFHDFSTLSGLAIKLFIVLMVMYMLLSMKINNFPGGWNPTKQWMLPSPKQFVSMELYPITKSEEFVFWIYVIFCFIETSIWMIFFGVFSFFIKIGS